MEDLRDTYNAKKSNSKKINWYDIYISNQNLIRLLTYLGVGIFVILSPDVIGTFIGNWVNSFHSALTPINIDSESWFNFLISLGIITVIYKIYSYKRKEE